MKSKIRETKDWSLLIALFIVIAGTGRANAAAIDDVQTKVSTTDICDGSIPSPQSFVVYAQNKNTARPISATFQYDSNPSSQSFQLYDANLSPYTDRFPKSLVIHIAAGATVPVGCTYNYRPSPSPSIFTFVPIVISVTGASYVNPSDPNPPAEDARAFAAFLLQPGSPSCPSGPKPQGTFLFVNLHPYAHLTAAFKIVHGFAPGLDLAPVSTRRVGCSNGDTSPVAAYDVKLVYPPGQK